LIDKLTEKVGENALNGLTIHKNPLRIEKSSNKRQWRTSLKKEKKNFDFDVQNANYTAPKFYSLAVACSLKFQSSGRKQPKRK
jgi:hypothetical protein